MKNILFISAILLAHIGNSQQITFQKKFGTATSRVALVTIDTFYLTCAGCVDTMGQGSECLLKFTKTGQPLWTIFYQATNGYASADFSIYEPNNSSLLLAGAWFNIGTGHTEAKIEKRDSNGQMLWIKSYGDSAFCRDCTKKRKCCRSSNANTFL